LKTTRGAVEKRFDHSLNFKITTEQKEALMRSGVGISNAVRIAIDKTYGLKSEWRIKRKGCNNE